MHYVISGLNSSEFAHLYGQDSDYLARHNARRVTADIHSALPDRIGLKDVPPGENAILLNHTYQPAQSPYHGQHAIFIHEGCTHSGVFNDEIPEYLAKRQLSLRAFNLEHCIIAAELATGYEVEQTVLALLQRPETAYIHAHSAQFGCYLARVSKTL
ncbi:DUF1203 domain-containing protein [Pantoea rwandensis]|uniref:DUF1203 domain-containing protein n=1 Tax=Pantoea rwandensis TaxID=1076550 RepID=A0A1X1CSM5_9GAMM|nr:DUF1203 domain-containing protein [Pantoea rwandensis]ORM67341.1 hypothetical protein HA51_19705 [Pantoea rwandensis]